MLKGLDELPSEMVFCLMLKGLDELPSDDDDDDDVMMVVLIGVAMGQGVEIGAELVLSSRRISSQRHKLERNMGSFSPNSMLLNHHEFEGGC